MYTLLSGLWKYAFQKNEYFILIIGMDKAGKTTLVEQLKYLYIPNHRGVIPSKITQTVGLNVCKVEAGPVRLVLWDLGGLASLHSIWDRYYAEAHAVVFVVDASDRAALPASQAAYNKMVLHRDLDSVPLLVLANKVDADAPLSLDQLRQAFPLSSDVIGPRNARLAPISALSGDGVRDVVQWLVDQVQLNARQPQPNDVF